MAFPFTYEANFEAGTTAEFDSETDSSSKLNIRHWTKIKSTPGNAGLMPYRGAYCMEVDLNGAAATQYLQENDGFDIAANATLYVRLIFLITTDLTMAASDRFTLLALQNTSNVDEAVIDVRSNAGIIQVLAAETGAATTLRATDLELGKWHTAELFVNIDENGEDDGTLDFYLDGVQVGAQITGLDQGAITHARLGAQGIDAGTTAGRIYVNEIAADDARLYPYAARYPFSQEITKSQHFFVGPGWIDTCVVLSTASDNVIKLYDTDTANVLGDEYIAELDPDASISVTVPLRFQKGCYIQLEGTSPRALIKAVTNNDVPGVHGPYTRT